MEQTILGVIALIIVIVSLFFIAIFILDYIGITDDNPVDTSNDNSASLNSGSLNSINNVDSVVNDETENGVDASSTKKFSNVGGSGGGSSGGSDSSSITNNEETVPEESDAGIDPMLIYNSNCGQYFFETNICDGVCPKGECVTEQDSCYCKIST